MLGRYRTTTGSQEFLGLGYLKQVSPYIQVDHDKHSTPFCSMLRLFDYRNTQMLAGIDNYANWRLWNFFTIPGPIKLLAEALIH